MIAITLAVLTLAGVGALFATGVFTNTISLAGINISSTITRTKEGQQSVEPSLPAGKTGTLSTRTDDNTGVVTAESGHGITISDTVDVYWTGGVRYGMSVTNVATDDVTVDLGDGDVLPDQDTAVIITPRVEVDIDFTGDNVEMFAALCDKRAYIEFTTEGDANITESELLAGEAWSWHNNSGVTNPFASAVVGKVQATCGEATAGTLQIGVLLDSV